MERWYSMERFYSVIGRSRQAYQKAIASHLYKSQTDQAIVDQVLFWRSRHPKMGSRTLYYTMKQAGLDLPKGNKSKEKLLTSTHLTGGSAKGVDA
ncbi:MAG: hypothetical protein AAGA77_25885 [Bacteroidota bacterium]